MVAHVLKNSALHLTSFSFRSLLVFAISSTAIMWSFSWVLWINILALYCYASPKPNLPAGYSVTATTDASGSVHEEIGVLTTISGSVSFVPKWVSTPMIIVMDLIVCRML